MSRGHLQFDHRMMRHRDTNRMDVKNLDVSWCQCHRVDLAIDPECYDQMHLRRVNRRMMVCPMTDDQKMI